jgi:hypothetical protein
MPTDEETRAAEDAAAARLRKALVDYNEFIDYLSAEEKKHRTPQGDAYLTDENADAQNAIDAGLVYGSFAFWQFCRNAAESAAVDRATEQGIHLPRIMRK